METVILTPNTIQMSTIADLAMLPESDIDKALQQLRSHIYRMKQGATTPFEFNPHAGRTLNLEGAIAPKARPRSNSNTKTFYMPMPYRDWKDSAIWDLRSQYQGEPLSGVEVAITLIGKHNRGSDADNVEGAILDALVQARILKDDSLMHVPALSLRLKHGKESAIAQILITDYIHR